MRFPLIGSAVLFSLFLLFKVLPKVRAHSLDCVVNMRYRVPATPDAVQLQQPWQHPPP
jgi:hypothetical protein